MKRALMRPLQVLKVLYREARLIGNRRERLLTLNETHDKKKALASGANEL